MLRMDDDQEGLIDLASDSIGPSGPFGMGTLPVAGIIVVGLILVTVLYISQHPHSFLARLLSGHH